MCSCRRRVPRSSLSVLNIKTQEVAFECPEFHSGGGESVFPKTEHVFSLSVDRYAHDVYASMTMVSYDWITESWDGLKKSHDSTLLQVWTDPTPTCWFWASTAFRGNASRVCSSCQGCHSADLRLHRPDRGSQSSEPAAVEIVETNG